MTVVNIHGRPEQARRADTPWSAWLSGRPRPASLNFWLTGIAFLALYLGLNAATLNQFGEALVRRGMRAVSQGSAEMIRSIHSS
jgi:hypothetical protein